MIIDAREFEDGFELEADLCIAGTGAAGITLASMLDHSEISICVLESGGTTIEAETQELYQGSYSGGVPTLDDRYLESSRLRYFGGTTNHWGGWCRPLESIDFEVRDWVSDSGWPFSKSDLDPYYERAAEFLEIESFERDNPEEGDLALPALLDDDVFRGKFYQMRRLRFGRHFGRRVSQAPNIQFVHHANVVEVVPNESGKAAVAFRIATLSGVRGEVRAKTFVLATGGIENARLLLCSDRLHPRGMGNDHDLVGRYFMEHAVLRSGPGPMVIWPDISLALYNWRGDPRAGRVQHLYLSDSFLRAEKLLTSALAISQFDGYQSADALDREVTRSIYDLDRREGPERAEPTNDPRAALQFVETYFMCEQEPNPESRVKLTDDRDALGLRRVELAWRLKGAEIETIDRFANLFGRKLASSGLGRLKTPIGSDAFENQMGFGNHHMGTTRMHDDPRRGVVNADGRVHGIENLYVAGSSVFPTSGVANPTFTILALTIRLADHLKGRFGVAL